MGPATREAVAHAGRVAWEVHERGVRLPPLRSACGVAQALVAAPMATQSPSGRARHPTSVAVAPLTSPSRVKVSAEKPGGGGRALLLGTLGTTRDSKRQRQWQQHGQRALAEGGPGRQGTGTAHLCGKGGYDMGTGRPHVQRQVAKGSSVSMMVSVRLLGVHESVQLKFGRSGAGEAGLESVPRSMTPKDANPTPCYSGEGGGMSFRRERRPDGERSRICPTRPLTGTAPRQADDRRGRGADIRTVNGLQLLAAYLVGRAKVPRADWPLCRRSETRVARVGGSPGESGEAFRR